MQRLLGVSSHDRNIMEHDVHHDGAIAQLRTRVDLGASTVLSRGALLGAFESPVQGYDEAAREVMSVVSLEDLVRWAP